MTSPPTPDRGGFFGATTCGRLNLTPTHFRATIAAFNQRAQKACFAVGFAPVATFIATTNGEEYVVLMLAC